MADKYDETCECAVIVWTKQDEDRWKDSPADSRHLANWQRAVINHGIRAVLFDAYCPHCQGTGH